MLVEAHRDVFTRRAWGKPYAPGSPSAATIAELRARCAEEGTSSLLDIERFSARPAPGAAAPLRPSELLDLFGTTRPALDDFDDAWADLFERVGRGEALYVVAYAEGKPSHVVFVGCSFD